MFTRDQLLTVQTIPSAIDELKLALTGSGFDNITDATEGVFVYNMLQLNAKTYVFGQNLAATMTANAIEKSASGDFLTEISDSFFNNQRIGATTTIGKVALFFSTASPYVFAPGGMLIDFVGSDAVQYTLSNQSQITHLAADVGEVQYVYFVAQDPGAGPTNILVGTSGSVQGASGIQALIRADSTLIDSWMATKGTDEESDQSLHVRNETKWSLLSVAETPADRIRNSVASASNGAVFDTYVNANNPRGPGTVDIYCASADAPATVPQLNAISGTIQALFMNGGQLQGGYPRINLLPAQSTTFGTGSNTSCPIYYTQNVTLTNLKTAVHAAADAWIESVPVGGKTFASAVANIADIDSLINFIYDVDGVAKAGPFTNQADIDLSSPPYQKLVAPTSWDTVFTYIVLPRSFA